MATTEGQIVKYMTGYYGRESIIMGVPDYLHPNDTGQRLLAHKMREFVDTV